MSNYDFQSALDSAPARCVKNGHIASWYIKNYEAVVEAIARCAKQPTIGSCNEKVNAALLQENEFLRGCWNDLKRIVGAQAEDAALWLNTLTITEAYLQQELRRLHADIESVEWHSFEYISFGKCRKCGFFGKGLDTHECTEPSSENPSTPTDKE